MNKEWVQITNELLEKLESRKDAILDKRERLEAEMKLINEQLTALKQRIQAGHDLIGDFLKEYPSATTTPDNIKLSSLANKSYPELVIEIAKQSPSGILTLKGTTEILHNTNIGVDKKTIRHNVGNTLLRLSKLGKHFANIGRGQYRFTNHVAVNGMTETKRIGSSNRTREVSGVRDAVKALKDKNPQMSKKEVIAYLIQTGFDFKGKNPAKAVNFPWVYWGYSKEGKQQPLPIGASMTMHVSSVTATGL